MPLQFQVSSIELSLHILLFFVALATPVILYLGYAKLAKGELRTIVGFFTLAFVFSALRWMGGSLARLHLPFTDLLWFNFLWTLTGILSAVFALYAANVLYDYSRKCVITMPKKRK